MRRGEERRMCVQHTQVGGETEVKTKRSLKRCVQWQDRDQGTMPGNAGRLWRPLPWQRHPVRWHQAGEGAGALWEGGEGQEKVGGGGRP